LDTILGGVVVETGKDYLKYLSEKVGVAPDKVFDSLVQNEFAYGVTSGIVFIILFWGSIFLVRYSAKRKKQEGWHSSWEVGIIIGLLAAAGFLGGLGNSVHHIMSPESYAIKDIYQIVEEGTWNYDD
jgi:hypothetical protein